MKFRNYAVAVSFAGLVWLLGGHSIALAGKQDDTMVVAIRRDIRSVDHLYTVLRESIILSELTDDGLLVKNPETFKYVPLAAKSFRQVDDTTLDFDIRENVRFHNGGFLTADDVLYSFNLMLDVTGGTKRGRKVRGWLKSIKKTGPMSVRMKLSTPYPLALRDIATAVQLRRKGTYHTGGGTVDRKVQREALNGIGPYRVVSFEAGRKIVVEQFPGYYKDSPKGRPAIKRIVFRIIPNWVTQQGELVNGNVDWMYDVPTDIARTLGGLGQAIHLNGPSLRVGYIVMDAANVTGKNPNPFTDLKVRRAMNHAIDRRSIVDNIVKGSSRVLHTACHPIQFGCSQDVMKYDYDPAKARQLLEQAGYPRGFDFEFWVYREKPAARAIVADLRKTGIRAKIRYVSPGRLSKGRRRQEVSAYFGSWGSTGTADTSAIAYPHWNLSSNRNMSGDVAVDRDVKAAQRTLDPAVRKKLYREALHRIAGQAYWVPLYTFTLNYLTSKELDFPVPKDGLPRLYRARWK